MDAKKAPQVNALVQRCQALVPGFSERASRSDRDGTFPTENFDALRAAGLLGIMVPERFGGLGANFESYTLALEQLAMGDAATALTFNMHNITMGALAELELDKVEGARAQAMAEFQRWVFDEAVTHQRLFASATSEPGVGASYSKLSTRYRKVDGGYELEGVKSFVSMAGHADYYVVAARAEEARTELPEVSFFVVERDNPGIQFENDWDVLGMRATHSHTMRLNACFVPRERVFLRTEGMAFYRILRSPHWQVGGYNGVYLGICTATFAFLVDYLKKKKSEDRSLAQNPVVQYKVGELDLALASAREVTLSAARLVVERPGTLEANVAVHRAKYAVSELGPRLASEAIRMCGASAISRKLPLERYYRDARCGGLMPARSDDCLMYAGKAALGVDVFSSSETYW